MTESCETTTTNQPVYPSIRKPLSRSRVITEVPGESVTDTSFGNETDVNAIIARTTRTGVLPEPAKPAQYADVTALQGDLTETIERTRSAMAELQDAQKKQQEAAAAAQVEKQKKYEEMEKKLQELEKNQQITKPVDGQ